MKKFSSLLTGEETTINDRMSGDRRGGLAMFHCSTARQATPLPHASPYERWRHITIYGREPNPQRVRHFASGGPFRSIARWVPANSSSSVPSLTPSSFRISAELLVAISHSFALPPHCSLSRCRSSLRTPMPRGDLPAHPCRVESEIVRRTSSRRSGPACYRAATPTCSACRSDTTCHCNLKSLTCAWLLDDGVQPAEAAGLSQMA